MKNLIIEGLSGAGKSIIIKLLEKKLQEKNIDYILYDENETFGDLTEEIKDINNSDIDKCFRLYNILKKLNINSELKILERFHLSYYALIQDWNLYKEIDEELFKDNFLIVFLDYADNLIFDRAINHADLKHDGLALAIDFFGSKEKAFEAYLNSKNNRKKALNLTKLKFIEIDTSEMLWEKYTSEILTKLL
ncbi:MAG: hypothetical protein U0457_14035 [Candidatus Sericytochromatia bacterium]